METRQIQEVKMYYIVLNPMTGSFEDKRAMASSTNKQKLIERYNEQKSEEEWRDGRYTKVFKKGSPLEWCNPYEPSSDGLDERGRGRGEGRYPMKILEEKICIYSQ